MTALLVGSALTRFMATLFLFLVLVGASVIVGIEIIENQPLSPYAIALVSGGLSYSLTLLGIHLGNGNTAGGASTQ
jgi:hypothetical protein